MQIGENESYKKRHLASKQKKSVSCLVPTLSLMPLSGRQEMNHSTRLTRQRTRWRLAWRLGFFKFKKSIPSFFFVMVFGEVRFINNEYGNETLTDASRFYQKYK
ncbi:hypothetical protein CEXT_740711 [Caerostris extrusa]|uniref:Ribosomal protein S19 n=1 Tax=Caerostris extrusa TaxID=172846 RepID=A0AAV4V6I2_CAEEX|nr:hypothetical protein CEXT_740711 [Caerostris extrusa]